MKKVIKWVCIIGGGLIVLIIAALLIIPRFVDVQKYKPEIEKKVAEATGRPFALGGDLRLSLFPWAGISLSDVRMGNPPGFGEKNFVTVKSFEVRVKLLPLLSRDIQVKRFVLKGPRIVLVKRKDGRGNWEGIGKEVAEPQKRAAGAPGGALPVKALTVGRFSITDGLVRWIDRAGGVKKEISDITLRLKDVSLDRPVRVAFSARMDGKPVSLEGKVGPIGREPGKGTVSVDLALKALGLIDLDLKGHIKDPAARPRFDMAVRVAPFSPRKLAAALGREFPVKTADPAALEKLGVSLRVKGDPSDISISDGKLALDESSLRFSARARKFSRPDLRFNLDLDRIDLDRYLPPAAAGGSPADAEKAPAPAAEKKTDYGPLRRLLLDGTVHVGSLKAHGVGIQDLKMKLSAKNGVIRVDPLTLRLYQGEMAATAALDVRKNTPLSSMAFRLTRVQAGPLLQDLLKKDIIEGLLNAEASVRVAGDTPDRIKQTLNGKGDFIFKDGAIKGIDLAGMVRNLKATFGLTKKSSEKPRTDFSELHCPFTIANGRVHTPNTSMKSPFLRVLAAGDADLVGETLDFRVEPKFVTSVNGQGDIKKRSGIMVPVLVTGTFANPKFRPDLKGMFQKRIKEGLSDPSRLKEMLKGKNQSGTEAEEPGKDVKGMLKGLFKK